MVQLSYPYMTTGKTIALTRQAFVSKAVSLLFSTLGFPGGSEGSVCLQCGRSGFNPGEGRSPGEGNGNPLQYSDLEDSIDCIVHGVAKSQTRLSNFTLG